MDGPYAIALGPRYCTELTRTTEQGYPVMEHVKRLPKGRIVWAPAVDGAVAMSLRGGDFELHVGQNFSIGYIPSQRVDRHPVYPSSGWKPLCPCGMLNTGERCM